jgi:cytochrome c-type biogenesis protein CcmH
MSRIVPRILFVTLLLFFTVLTVLYTAPSVVHAQGAPSIEVTIDITPELRRKAGPDQVVFVFAKAVQGPRAPLAAVKLKVKDLPATVLLDDSKSVAPMFRLSRFKKVLVSARVSQSGQPMKGSGDLEGVTQVITLAQGKLSVTVTINHIVP